jgi:EmrB/QacA subfamily drug resistance transporter
VACTRGALQRKRLALAAAIIGSGVGMLDSTIVNIALPTIQRSLGGGLAAEQWVVNAYVLTLGALILVGGSLEDVFGTRRVFALGVGGFGFVSVLCGLAPTIGVLVGLRALQGVAGALLVPSSLALIVATFPEAERGRAIGTWTAFTTVATVIGPLAGGALLAIGSWRWLFFINVPFVLACLALIWTAVPKAQARASRRVDLAGAGTAVTGLGGTVFALIEQPRFGWTSPAVLIPLAVGVLSLWVFVVIERRSRDPMLPFALFARPNFGAANLETFSVYAGLGVLIFFLVIFLQQVAGYSPLSSGLATLPATVIVFGASRPFGALAGRLGPRRFMAAGPLIGAAGLFLLLRVGSHPSYLSDILPAVALFGVGLAMTVAPLTATVLNGVASAEAGIASAVNNAVARVAGLLGTAAVGSVLAARFAASLAADLHGVRLGRAARAAVLAARHLSLGRPALGGVPARQAQAIDRAANAASVTGFHVAVAVAAGLLVLGGLVGAFGIGRVAPASAGRRRVGEAIEQRIGVHEVDPDG